MDFYFLPDTRFPEWSTEKVVLRDLWRASLKRFDSDFRRLFRILNEWLLLVDLNDASELLDNREDEIDGSSLRLESVKSDVLDEHESVHFVFFFGRASLYSASLVSRLLRLLPKDCSELSLDTESFELKSLLKERLTST